MAEGLPVLGICYGHQLRWPMRWVARWPTGIRKAWRSAPSASTKSDAARHDPLFADLPDTFPAHVVRQTARRLPPGGQCLASSDFEPHHAFRFGEAAWGVQFHRLSSTRWR